MAGELRGLRLRVPRGLEVRPTSDRLRGAVFSALGDGIDGARVWDACAGTGAVGIEALSRGALRVTFSDSGRAALEALRANLEHAAASDRARLLPVAWARAAERLRDEGERFEIVYFDPPFASGPTSSGPTSSGPTSSGPISSGPTSSGPTSSGPTPPCIGPFLETVAPLLADGGVVVVEHPRGDTPPATASLVPRRTLVAGAAAATLFRRAGKDAGTGGDPR